METNKLTRRQKYTVRVIQEAYLELVEEKPASEITITELCEQADVNRTTFYRYYKDLEDLGDQMSLDLFGQIFAVLAEEQREGTAREQITKALNATLKNRKLCRHLLLDSHSDTAERALEEHLTLLLDTILSTGCTKAEAQLCYGYICGGLARLWISWIAGNFKTPKAKVAIIVEALINSYYEALSSGFILKKA